MGAELSGTDRAIRELADEADALEHRLTVLRTAIATLTSIATPKVITASPPPIPPAAVNIARGSEIVVGEAEKAAHQRGDTTRMVFETIKQNPGITSTRLGDMLMGRVTSNAKDPRRLIINAVGYLYSKGRVKKGALGWEVNV